MHCNSLGTVYPKQRMFHLFFPILNSPTGTLLVGNCQDWSLNCLYKWMMSESPCFLFFVFFFSCEEGGAAERPQNWEGERAGCILAILLMQCEHLVQCEHEGGAYPLCASVSHLINGLSRTHITGKSFRDSEPMSSSPATSPGWSLQMSCFIKISLELQIIERVNFPELGTPGGWYFVPIFDSTRKGYI